VFDEKELNYFTLRKQIKEIVNNKSGLKEIRLAILGDNNTNYFTEILKVIFYKLGFYLEVFESHYDTISQQVLDENSDLYKFRPRYVLLYTASNYLKKKLLDTEEKERSTFAVKYIEFLISIWDKINNSLQCYIIQNNFEIPLERYFGNYSLKVQDSVSNIFLGINRSIIESSIKRNKILINDIEYLSSYHGKKYWDDDKLWISAKTICPMEFLPSIAMNIAQIVMSCEGKSKKCLILDLDNTLWGGVIGDDGIEKIEIGNLGIGEAFSTFQRYLKELKKRGIILAICSRNEFEIAVEPFRKHPDMVLREDDIAVFVANWESKAKNIEYISNVLNIGIDSIVFIDDSVFERNLIKHIYPEILVPDMPEDPAEFVKHLNQLNLFETISYTDEDKKRAIYYRDDRLRNEEKKYFTNIDDYLKSLTMVAEFKRIEEVTLPRISQLIQRTNQFNLTTKRYSEKELVDMLYNENMYSLYVTLKDKFGDNGIVAVLIAKREKEILVIDTWLMSCRVFSRGVEYFTMNEFVKFARDKGFRIMEGVYIPTKKNKIVSNLYKGMQFTLSESKADGSAIWRLDTLEFNNFPVFINKL